MRRKIKQLNRLLIASGTYLPEASGQSTFVSHIAENFKQRNIYVKIIAYGSSHERDDSIYRVERNKRRYWNYAQAIKKMSASYKLIYAQDLISSGFPSAMAKGRKNRLVVRIGGDFLWEKMINEGVTSLPLSEYYGGKKTRKEKVYLKIYKFVLKKADGLIFNSHFQKEIYETNFRLKKQAIAVIENPYHLDTKKLVEKKSKKKTILFAGRLVKVKNVEKLIDAFKRIGDDSVQLKIVGDGPFREKLEQRCVSDRRVKFTGEISHDRLLEEINSCSFFVLPSISEMHPNVALEALNAGKPAILTKHNGFPEKLRDFFYLVDPLSTDDIEQGLTYFLDDTNLESAKKMAESFYSEYGWKDIAQKHIDFFQSL